MSKQALTIRLSLFFAIMFSFWGVQMPFWPIWLNEIGFTQNQIALLMACTYLVKLTNPFSGYLADRYGKWLLLIIGLCVLALLTFIPHFFTASFVWLVLITLVNSTILSSLMTTSESMAVGIAIRKQVNYGRIRLSGSLGVVFSTIGVGFILGNEYLKDIFPDALTNITVILWIGAFLLLITLISCFVLLPPSEELQTPPRSAQTESPISIWALLKHPVFIALLLTISFSQLSHVAYYGISSLYWEKEGMSRGGISLLWSEGVIGEIVIFAFATRILRRLSPLHLIILGAVGCIIRWGVLSLTTDLFFIALVQWMHGITFGLSHIGTLFFIAHVVPKVITARAQALYFALPLGLFQAIGMMLNGPLYNALGGYIFLLMSFFGILGVACGLYLKKIWNGRPIELTPSAVSVP